MPASGKSWEQFALRLEGASTVAQARDLAFDAPPPSKPAERHYHSNLGFFLFNLEPPGAATLDELHAYVRLIDRFSKAGELKSEVAQKVTEALLCEIER